MHMPDGIIPIEQAIIYLVVSIIFIGISVWKSKKYLSMKQIPVIGVLAAGLFAAQMFNFPVIGGTSGHLIGTSLATVLVGPWVAILILSSILIVQALFGDGGFLAYGVNVLNMAIVGAFVTIGILYLFSKKWRDDRKKYAIIAGIAGFISTLFMAFFASTELAIANAGSPTIIYGSMMSVHAVIAIAEAIITFTIIFFLFKADNSIFQAAKLSVFGDAQMEETEPKFKFPTWAVIVSGGIFALMTLLGFVLPLIGGDNPDGLEATLIKISQEGSSYTIPIFNFPEGFGWDVLQMAILMVFLFIFLFGTSYLMYRIRLFQYKKKHEDSSIVIDDKNN